MKSDVWKNLFLGQKKGFLEFLRNSQKHHKILILCGKF